MSVSGIVAQEPPGQRRKLNAYQPPGRRFSNVVWAKSPEQMADPQIGLDMDRLSCSNETWNSVA
jgi:hypothetical protein